MCRHIITDRSLNSLARRYQPNSWQDLLQDVALKVAELSDKDVERITPYFNYWAVRCIQTTAISQFKSNRLTFTELESEPQQAESRVWEIIHQAEEVIGSAYWYDRELFKLYLDSGSFKAVEAQTGIDHVSVFKTCKRLTEKIKRNVLS